MRSLFLLFFICYSSIFFAQRKIFPHVENEKWGFINIETDEVVLPPTYSNLKKFHRYDYCFLTELNGKWGLFNSFSHKEILPCLYDEIKYIHHFGYNTVDLFGIKVQNGRFFKQKNSRHFYRYGLNKTFLVKLNGKTQLITPKGNFDLRKGDYKNPMLFFNVEKPEHGIFIMEKNGKYGGFSAEGKLLVPFVFDTIRCYDNALTRIEKTKPQFIEPLSLKPRPPIFTPRSGLVYLPLHLSFFLIDTSFYKLKNFQYNIQLPIVNNNTLSQNQKKYSLSILNKIGVSGMYYLVQNLNYGDEDDNDELPKITQSIKSLFGKIIIAKKNEYWNLINVQTSQIILADYDFIHRIPSRKDLIRVGKDESVGIWNIQKKEWEILCEYEDIKFWSSSFHIKKNGKWGMINRKGKVIVPIEYDEIQNSKIRKGEKWGLVNHRGRIIVPVKYDEVYNQHQVKEGKYWGVIDENQNWVLPPEYDKMSGSVGNLKVYKKNKVGYFSRSNKIFIEPNYQDLRKARLKKGNLFFVQKNDKWGMIDKNSNLLTAIKYDNFRMSGNQIISFQNEQCALMSKKGKELTPHIFSSIKRYEQNDGLFLRVKQGTQYGIIDTLGNWILPCKFDWVGPDFSNKLKEKPRLFPVKKDGKVGFAQRGGKVIIPCQYDNVNDFYQGVSIVMKDKEAYLINEKGKQITKNQYDNIYPFRKGETTTITSKNKKNGIVDHKGNEIFPPIYNRITRERGRYKSDYIEVFFIEKDDELKIVSLDGKLLLIEIYEKSESVGLPTVFSFKDK